MEERRSRSVAALDRDRTPVLGWQALVGLVLLVLVALALLFPRETLKKAVREEGGSDALATAYLTNLVRTDPRDEELRLLLAGRQFRAGAEKDARETLEPLLFSAHAQARIQARLLMAGLLESELNKEASGSDAHRAAQRRLRASLRALAREPLAAPALLELLPRAQAAADDSLARELTLRLVESGDALPAGWIEKAAASALGHGDYRLASQLWFVLQQRSADPQERRNAFMQALQMLQQGNLLGEVMAEADKHIDGLERDEQTLVFLIRLSQAAGDGERAQAYARRLMRMSARTRFELFAWLFDLIVPRAHAQAAAMRPYDEQAYGLAYDVFLANGNLQDALKVARSAVQQRPDDDAWRERLARTAEFAGQPAEALEQWKLLAARRHGEAAVQAILRLAPGLNDDEALLLAWRSIASTRALSEAEWRLIADLFERVGRPDEGIAYLTEAARKREQPIVLDRLAALQERTGHVEEAITAQRRLIEVTGTSPERALKLATLYLLRADFGSAYEALAPVESLVSAGDAAYWRMLADLAWQLDRKEPAQRALSALVRQEKPEADEFERLVQLLLERQPEEAARTAEAGWRRTGNAFLLLTSLEIHTARNDRGALARLFAAMRAQDEQQLAGNSFFFTLRAAYRRGSGDVAAALADYRRALELSPGNAELRNTLLFQLADAKAEPGVKRELQVRLTQWSLEASDNPAYWDAYVAGYLAVDQAPRALAYMRRQARGHETDYLWLAGYADVLEQAGQIGMAARVRRHAWLVVRAKGVPREAQRTPEMLAAARLATLMAPGDPALAAIRYVLRQDSPHEGGQGVPAPLDAAARELVLAWSLSPDQPPGNARAWLWKRYGEKLAAPAWARVSVALAENDLPELERLLQSSPGELPASTRSEIVAALGDRALAQTLSVEAHEARPFDDDLHLRMAEDLLSGARRLVLNESVVQRGSLSSRDTVARVEARIAPRLRLALDLLASRQSTNDSSRLAAVPSLDRSLLVSAIYEHARGETQATVGRRSALTELTSLRLSHTRPWLGTTLQFGLSSNERAVESAPLLIAGAKDEASAAIAWRVSRRDSLNGRSWGTRYQTQGGTALGSGRGLSLEAVHQLRGEYPDWNIRASHSVWHFSSLEANDPAANSLVPAGAAGGSVFFMPQSFRLWGVNLGWGTGQRDQYSRGLRPFLDVGRSVNSLSGGGYNWLVGAGGSLLGGDLLSIVWLRSQGAGGTGAAVSEFGLRYAYYFGRS